MHTFVFANRPSIVSTSTVVGKREAEGAYGGYFHHVMQDDTFGQETFEKTERQMLSFVIEDALSHAPKGHSEIDAIFSGDLMNQIISSCFAAREFPVAFSGLYGACSTMALSLALGAMSVDGGYYRNVLCCTCSHFSSVERQFRYPLELGTMRTPTAQWTVTGAGAAVIGRGKGYPAITRATLGRVVDYGIVDANNMGAAMAPAARDTLLTFLRESGERAFHYDCIITGDLGRLGSQIFLDLMREKGIDIRDNHMDCGATVFQIEKDNFQGGSGAGCSASVFNSYVVKKLQNKEWKRVLFMATGALLSTVSSFQGESIPAVAHLVEVEA